MAHMGVLENSDDTVMYSRDMPVTALLAELENVNALQHTGSRLRTTSNPVTRTNVELWILFTVLRFFKAHGQGLVIERIETIFNKKDQQTLSKRT